MKKLNFLYFIIFLEGYVVLSAELLAIRQVIPYVGNATDVVSIIIAAVLMPLAIGYYAGGHFKGKTLSGRKLTIRKKLLQNILIATIFLFFGLSHSLIDYFFQLLGHIGIENRIVMVSIYSFIFIVLPVYLLAQTIPLVSHFFKKEELAKITGKMLCFSTIGSFMGAIFSTLVLMSFVGVHHTAVITLGCLTVLYLLLSRNKLKLGSIFMCVAFIAALALNSDYVMGKYGIIENNQYNHIRVVEKQHGAMRVLSLNNNNSSVIIDKSYRRNEDDIVGQYIAHINKHFIKPTLKKEKVYSILVVGAGGFTVGINDNKNDYTFIDINSSLKDISEEHFLKEKLGKNKKFEAVPARGFIHQAARDNKKYDLIFLDAYSGNSTLPAHLVTQDFYKETKEILSEDGILIANFVISPNFTDQLSVTVDNTLRSVFPGIGRQVIHSYDAWNTSPSYVKNVLYIHYNKKWLGGNSIYTDNKNKLHFDKDKPLK